MSELLGLGSRVAVTPQNEQADARQVKNAAGGYVFTLDKFDHLARFLVLGTAGGTYYAGQREHTRQAVDTVKACLDEDGVRAVDLAVNISVTGRAPKNDQAIFVLALAAAHEHAHVRRAALGALSKVCRTGTHLFQFLEMVKEHRGWGPALRKAIARWYTDQDLDKLAYQMVKYRQRGGWTHRDALRVAHPKATGAHNELFKWATGADLDEVAPLPQIVAAFENARRGDVDTAALIREFGLPWEAIPTMGKADWIALIESNNLPVGAMIRQLPTLTRNGVFEDRQVLSTVLGKLTDAEALTRARIHPVAVLFALDTYKSGHSFRGSTTWTPVTAVIDALDEAFYASFGSVQPMGGSTLIALDVSGSMGSHRIANTSISARVASAAMALVTLRSEAPGSVDVAGFTGYPGDRFNPIGGGRWQASYYPGRPAPRVEIGRDAMTLLNISARQRLDDATRAVGNLPLGATDCALPMVWAQKMQRHYDRIIIFTDNDTWAGAIHPHEALRDYRKAANSDTKLIVVGMTATDFTIADPNDRGSLDVVGFDTAAPNLISAFARGEF